VEIQVNEEEDRRRLKEKLKEALESARRNHQLSDESEGQVLRAGGQTFSRGVLHGAQKRDTALRAAIRFRAVSRYGNSSSGKGGGGGGEESPGAEGNNLPLGD
jgi:hypothetical protein